MTQALIFIFSGAAAWCFATPGYMRAGFILALCGQPFWIYSLYTAGQWGALLVSLWFTWNYARGLWNYRG